MDWVWSDPWYWLVFGLLGQAAFFSRFLVQWAASERRGESIIPVSFWYLSLVGSVMLLVYAIHRQEPVFLLAYLPNAFVYTRNLMLIKRKEREERAAAVGSTRAETAVEPVRTLPERDFPEREGGEPPAAQPGPAAAGSRRELPIIG